MVLYGEFVEGGGRVMKFKILLLISIAFFSYAIYFYPVQKYFAEKNLEEYMIIQGTSSAVIQSKEILKDYKIGGYTISIVYADEPDYRYEYIYFPGEKELKDSMRCFVYDSENVEIGVTNKTVKYPPIN